MVLILGHSFRARAQRSFYLSGNAGGTKLLPVSVLKVVKHGECGKRLVVLVGVLSMKRNAVCEEQSENASGFVLSKLKIEGSKKETQCLLQNTKAVFDSCRTERGSTQSYKWMGKMWKIRNHFCMPGRGILKIYPNPLPFQVHDIS